MRPGSGSVETGGIGRGQVAPGAQLGGHKAQAPGRVAVVIAADIYRMTAVDVGEGGVEIDEAEGVFALCGGLVGDFDKIPALDVHAISFA